MTSTLRWTTNTTKEVWRKRPAKQILWVDEITSNGPVMRTLKVTFGGSVEKKTMDLPTAWQGSPIPRLQGRK